MNKHRARLIIGAAAMAAAIAWAPAAGAHAVLVRSAPAARATVAHPPDRVDLWFNERLEPAFSHVTVQSSAGKQVDRGNPRVVPDDPKRLSVMLEPLEPGTYTVRYRVLSVDGHVVDASFTFTVRARSGRTSRD